MWLYGYIHTLTSLKNSKLLLLIKYHGSTFYEICLDTLIHNKVCIFLYSSLEWDFVSYPWPFNRYETAKGPYIK